MVSSSLATVPGAVAVAVAGPSVLGFREGFSLSSCLGFCLVAAAAVPSVLGFREGFSLSFELLLLVCLHNNGNMPFILLLGSVWVT